MSLRSEWIKRVSERRLFELGFLILPGHDRVRTVLMSEEINGLICGPWESQPMAERCARLRADLESILAGDPITVCWDPFKAKKYHQIGRLYPPQDFMFDLRSADSPGLRVTLFFAEKDVLVALACRSRSIPVSWLHRLPLLDRSSSEWNVLVSHTHALWGELFPKHRPHSGDQVDDLLSNAYIC